MIVFYCRNIDTKINPIFVFTSFVNVVFVAQLAFRYGLPLAAMSLKEA
jgi:hypothetical protein